ncbi:hypothetical protein D9611_009818 [Ephemerocybe angulata]|uniref:Uncharacterized protein n=1 Tax=Ephemerocybe angulata TaxID=980116 RepID=A0A8H5CCU9_9AGAR|nr:hypothetical protein D9611_009818 [Tulosesus angulatus]
MISIRFICYNPFPTRSNTTLPKSFARQVKRGSLAQKIFLLKPPSSRVSAQYPRLQMQPQSKDPMASFESQWYFLTEHLVLLCLLALSVIFLLVLNSYHSRRPPHCIRAERMIRNELDAGGAHLVGLAAQGPSLEFGENQNPSVRMAAGITNLKRTITEKDKSIAELQSQLSKSQMAIRNLLAQAEEQKRELRRLHDRVLEDEALAETLKREIGVKDSRLFDMEYTLLEKDTLHAIDRKKLMEEKKELEEKFRECYLKLLRSGKMNEPGLGLFFTCAQCQYQSGIKASLQPRNRGRRWDPSSDEPGVRYCHT